MKAIHRIAIALSLSLATLFLIVGTATAYYVSPENPATDTGLKQVPYNINGVFTTVSGITYDSSSGEFTADNSGIVYTVTQDDRLLTVVEDISGSLCSLSLIIKMEGISSAMEMMEILNVSEAVQSSQMTFSQRG